MDITEVLCRLNAVDFMVTPCINNTEHFLLPTDAHNVKKRKVITSDFIPLLSNLLFISLNFYSHITYISFITVTICSHSTDDALHIFYADTLNQTCNL